MREDKEGKRERETEVDKEGSKYVGKKGKRVKRERERRR